MAAGLSFLETQPSRRYKTIQQIAGLIGIKAPAQGLAANIHERNYGRATGLNPPQGAPEVLVTVCQSDLAQSGARVWQKYSRISVIASAIGSSATSSGSMAALINPNPVASDGTSCELAHFK